MYTGLNPNPAQVRADFGWFWVCSTALRLVGTPHPRNQRFLRLAHRDLFKGEQFSTGENRNRKTVSAWRGGSDYACPG